VAANYPIRPRPDDDPRFTLELMVDLAEVLEKVGYPKLTGEDIVDLRRAVSRFLYSDR
jgi:hypothetical protein